MEPFLRKLRYQPTNYQQHRSYRTSRTPVQQSQTEILKERLLKKVTYERSIFNLENFEDGLYLNYIVYIQRHILSTKILTWQ